jgi:hypothetical protein
MRIDAVKINRSGVYYLINTVAPINHAFKAEFDAFGSMIVFWFSGCSWPVLGNRVFGAICFGLGAVIAGL